MKFSLVLIGVLAVIATVYGANKAPVADVTDRFCAITKPTPCDEVVQSVVVQHYGDDYQAGDMLHDQINELVQEDDLCRREILLKCKHAGCKFFLSATTEINIEGAGGLKIRGLLKDGRRPIIWNTGPIILKGGSLLHFEKVNFQADGFSSSQSNIVVDNDAASLTIFDECDFIGHSAGFGNGGALLIQGGQVKITSCKFINNAAKQGGAIAIDNTGAHGGDGCVQVLDSAFVDNAAIEQGGALWVKSWTIAPVFWGCHFKGNTANKKGDTFVGEGGAIYTELALFLYETRSHGGNSAQFGNFMFATSDAGQIVIQIDGFGCYEGPFQSVYHGARGDYETYDSYHAYPVCSADSYDSYAPREDIYAENNVKLEVTRIDLPGGVICAENQANPSSIERSDCGSYVQSYHCDFESSDKPIEAEDYDRDGFDCRYDCNDLWDTVNPAASEQCNDTLAVHGSLGLIGLRSPRGYALYWLSGDSNCNGLSDEFIDTDGDWVPDDVDRCPLDYWKIDPGHCGCGIEETDGCASADAECGTTEYGGVWYYMCEGQWWYWGENDWTYGGTY